MSGWKPSQAQESRFEGVRSSKPLYIAPYILSWPGYSSILTSMKGKPAMNAARSPPSRPAWTSSTAFTSNLTMDLTVNTDFA